MAFRVLGPVEVVRDGAVVPLGQRTLTNLFAVLAVSPGQVVTAEAIIQAVWPATAPAHPRATLHSAVARLRRMIGDDFIETHPSGYTLRATAADLDLLRFEELRAAAVRPPRTQPQGTESALAALTEAVALWRGMPLANVGSPVLQASAVPRLTELYLVACEDWAELSLGAGQQDEVISRLAGLADAHPFRERVAELLMLALYRSGRKADALAVYEAVRHPLREELGIDPGPALQSLHLKILRADPSLTGPPRRPDAAAVVAGGGSPLALPRELPRDLPDFRGRGGELAEVTRFIKSASPAPGRAAVVVISGKGGIGKTALAVHAAHAASAAFPDGQLFADLHGGDPHGGGLRPTPAATVLAGFLRALGVTGPALPSSIADRAALFRSLTAGRRLLLVLDNAASEVQVRPLLPASASCAVIVTSRARMAALPGARSVHLDALGERHAVDLLAAIIGPARAAAETEDAGRLAVLCGGLPLALRIVGTRLAARPHWPLAGLVGRLDDERRRLGELAHGDLDVRATFAVSYQALNESAKDMLRRLSLLKAPDFPAWAGAALLDIDPGQAAEICERLVDAQLLDPAPPAPVTGAPSEIRYRFHDLVRMFARELAGAAETEAVRAAALDRAYGAWLSLAEQAHRHVYGGDYTILHGAAARWTGADADQREAIRRNPVGWLEGERLAIAAIIRQSAETGRSEVSWDLTLFGVTLWEARGLYGDWSDAVEHALTAARSAGDERGTAAMLACLAALKFQNGLANSEVLALAEQALTLFSLAGDTLGCAITRYRIAVACSREGDLDRAIREFERSRREARQAGDAFMEAHILHEIGTARLQRGEHAEAARCLAESLRLHKQTGSLRGQALTLRALGQLRLQQGEPETAIGIYRQVLAMIKPASDIIGHAYASIGLGQALATAGQPDQGRERLLTALRLGRQFGSQPIESRAQQALDQLAQSAQASDERRNHATVRRTQSHHS